MNADTLSKRRRRRLFDIVGRMGEYGMKNTISNPFTEPQSDREVLMVIANEISHLRDVIDELRENQNDIRKSLSVPSIQEQELKIRLDNVCEKLDELKKGLEENDKILTELQTSQERYNTYFKILGAFAVLFPSILLTIFQILWG